MSEKKIGDILRNMYKDNASRGKLYEARIKAHWEDLFGPIIVKYTSRLRLQNKTLFIELSSAPLKSELSIGQAQMIKTINESIGEDYVEKIVFL